MATFLRTTGESEDLAPANGINWSLEELQKLVGGYIEIVRTLDGRFMVINEMGKVVRPMLPLNIQATRMYLHGRRDPIVGDAVVVDTLLEMNGPDEETA
jgi:hypothetical protein